MAAALLLALAFTLLSGQGACAAAGTILTSVREVGSKTQLTCSLNSSGVDIVGHRWMRGDKVLQEDTPPDLQMQYMVDADGRSGEYSCIFLPGPVGRGNINVEGPPRIKVGKKSEHASEGEFMKLICKSEASHPPVDEWVWFKTSDAGDQTISNGTEANSKHIIVPTPEMTELTINNLDLNVDPAPTCAMPPTLRAVLKRPSHCVYAATWQPSGPFWAL